MFKTVYSLNFITGGRFKKDGNVRDLGVRIKSNTSFTGFSRFLFAYSDYRGVQKRVKDLTRYV